MKAILTDGKKWEEIPMSHGMKKWSSDCNDFEILLTSRGKYRLVALEHDPSTQFPDAEFWMREYDSLVIAAHQAECM
jgi:hypothetical protein